MLNLFHKAWIKGGTYIPELWLISKGRKQLIGCWIKNGADLKDRQFAKQAY
jgi:hypothetical protein